MQKGHVVRLQFRCRRCQQYKKTWSSSRIFSAHYLVNQKYAFITMYNYIHHFSYLFRLIHSFTCAGLLQTQYIKFCQSAGLGTVQNGFIRHGTFIIFTHNCVMHKCMLSVYNKKGYADIVAQLSEQSMQAAVEEVKCLPHYESDGEVCMYIHYNIIIVCTLTLKLTFS